jgi:hypothetical protein
LLAGDSITGKSTAWLEMAQQEFTAGSGVRFFVLDTEDGLGAYLDEDGPYAHLYFEEENGNVYPYTTLSWEEIAGSTHDIFANQRPRRGDWVIIDVADRMYDYAQLIISEQPQLAMGNLDDTVVSRGLNKQGFGAFDGGDWNLVSRTHDSVMNELMATEANIMALVHVTDYVVNREKRTTQVMFDSVGVKPRGRPTLPSIMDTVCVIWSRQHIPMNERGQRQKGAKSYTERMMFVGKDRGKSFQVIDRFDLSFWDKLKEIRAKKLMPENITSDKQLEELGIDPDEAGEITKDNPTAPDTSELEAVAEPAPATD